MYQMRSNLLKRALVSLTAAAIALVGCSRSNVPISAEPPSTPAPPTVTASVAPGSVEPLTVTPAKFATALAQSPDGRLFYAERGGTIKVAGQDEAFAQIRVSQSGERGLLGLALDPAYPSTPFVYAFASPRENEAISRVIRFTDRDGRGMDQTNLIELPAGSGCCHKGGRIKFGPDGKLYVTVGENQVPRAAASTDDLRGKILRYNPDGTPAAGNPFGASNPVWAYGLRNPFGIGFSPDGSMFATDNGPSGGDGPSCCDSAKKIERGGDYGWPDRFGDRGKPKGIAPIWTSGDSVVVPTGLAIVSSDRLPQLRGALVFCTYANHEMFVLTQDGADWPGGLSEPGKGPSGCELDVIQGHDGYLYFSDETAIYRIG